MPKDCAASVPPYFQNDFSYDYGLFKLMLFIPSLLPFGYIFEYANIWSMVGLLFNFKDGAMPMESRNRGGGRGGSWLRVENEVLPHFVVRESSVCMYLLIGKCSKKTIFGRK